MKDILLQWRQELEKVIRGAWNLSLTEEQKFSLLEWTEDPKFGDFSSGIAFKLSKELKKPPRDVASKIKSEVEAELGKFKYLLKVEIAGAGYVNFKVSEDFYAQLVKQIHSEGDNFGRSTLGKGIRANIEFCSANPTGPLTVAHGRQTAIGDVLARLLSFCGYEVTCEYYLNDCGNQVHMLGRSIYSRYCELLGKSYPFPEEGYHGEYVKEIAQDVQKRCGDKYLHIEEMQALAIFSKMGVDIIMGWIDKDLSDFGVTFDKYYSQEALEKSGKVEALLKTFKEQGWVYEKEGASWLKTKEYGDAEDRVLIKKDGSYTYRTPDMAYHKDKFDRGFEQIIDLWGPDHHAHILGMRAALRMLGYPEQGHFRVLIIQHCRLLRGGQEVKMSKRAATYVTLRELLDEVGRDAARYFFAMRKTDSHLDFDIEVARKQTAENPVYYVQYAYARISSIFRKGREEGLIQGEASEVIPEKLGDEEAKLAHVLLRFPDIVESAAGNLDTERLTRYLYDLAWALQFYYQKGDKEHQYRVLCENEPVRNARLAVVRAVQIVLKNGLSLLGVSAPERMEREG